MVRPVPSAQVREMNKLVSQATSYEDDPTRRMALLKSAEARSAEAGEALDSMVAESRSASSVSRSTLQAKVSQYKTTLSDAQRDLRRTKEKEERGVLLDKTSAASAADRGRLVESTASASCRAARCNVCSAS